MVRALNFLLPIIFVKLAFEIVDLNGSLFVFVLFVHFWREIQQLNIHFAKFLHGKFIGKRDQNSLIILKGIIGFFTFFKVQVKEGKTL